MTRNYIRECIEPASDQSVMEGNYSKKYYLPDGSVGMIEDYYDSKLFKVSYRQWEPPYSEALTDHIRNYPGAFAEFVTPARPVGDGTWESQTTHYTIDGQFEYQEIVFQDAEGKLMKSVRLGPDGEPIYTIQHLYDSTGRWIGERLLNPKGEITSEHLLD